MRRVGRNYGWLGHRRALESTRRSFTRGGLVWNSREFPSPTTGVDYDMLAGPLSGLRFILEVSRA